MALSEHDIELLEDLLFSEHLEEETLDYFGLHGLVCASIVGPAEISPDAISTIVLGEDKTGFTEKSQQHLLSCIQKIASKTKDQLLQGIDITLPYLSEEQEFEACLESWCIGFIEGFFYHEKTWFEREEDVAAELLLPIMALSGLFDSDEFQEVTENDKLMSQFEDIIPSQLIDIYLYYHAE